MLIKMNNVPFKKKPSSNETGWIRNNMQLKNIDIYNLRNRLCFGQTVQPAILNKSGEFSSQQVFFVDIDKSSVSKTIAIAKENNLCPNIIYRTFSGGIRHRLVFVFENPITNINERDKIADVLNLLFDGDAMTKSLNNLFYGGTLCYLFNPYLLHKKEEVLKYAAA